MAFKRVVIKIGTKVITANDRSIDRERVKDLVDQVAGARKHGTDVVIVTSGAIGAGMSLLGMKKRPKALDALQAAASVGQGHLMHIYSEYFKSKGHIVGQILLTQEDFNDRARYLNIRYTLRNLLARAVVPIINENDSVSTDEIRCGDNDRLAGLVSDLCEADLLILLTDVDGLLDASGKVISIVHDVSARVKKLARATACDLGTGGMATKLEAVRRVTQAGIECTIANGRSKSVIAKVLAGKSVGTTFPAGGATMTARERWIAHSSRPKGTILVDAGAREALLGKHRSLLASGIAEVTGSFACGDVVRITDGENKEVARGVTNFTSAELVKIKGMKTAAFAALLGRECPDEVVHKDDLVIS